MHTHSVKENTKRLTFGRLLSFQLRYFCFQHVIFSHQYGHLCLQITDCVDQLIHYRITGIIISCGLATHDHKYSRKAAYEEKQQTNVAIRHNALSVTVSHENQCRSCLLMWHTSVSCWIWAYCPPSSIGLYSMPGQPICPLVSPYCLLSGRRTPWSISIVIRRRTSWSIARVYRAGAQWGVTGGRNLASQSYAVTS